MERYFRKTFIESLTESIKESTKDRKKTIELYLDIFDSEVADYMASLPHNSNINFDNDLEGKVELENFVQFKANKAIISDQASNFLRVRDLHYILKQRE